jgi:glycosyltransferase involved in cell wall biosynthesis
VNAHDERRHEPVQRVLFVAAMSGLGGPVRRLATLLTHLHGVEKVLIKPSSRKLDRAIRDAGSVDEHIALRRSARHDRLGALVIALAILRRCLRRSSPIDVIHANGLVEFALAWPTALLFRIPVVTWVGNYEPPASVQRFHRLFHGVAARTSWNAVSSFAADVIVECGLARREDVQVITNIVDPADVAPDPSDAAAPADAGHVTVGYLQVARWEKGFDLLAPVVSRLADLEGRLRFVVYGTPSDDPGWRELEACPTAMVEVRPRTAEVGQIYAGCDVVFSPSRRESFNRVVAEALTTGTPVVASDLEPVLEVVGDAGLVFPTEDVSAAADQVRRLVEDPQLRAMLGQRGRERSSAWLPGPVAERFEQLYRASEGGRRASPLGRTAWGRRG